MNARPWAKVIGAELVVVAAAALGVVMVPRGDGSSDPGQAIAAAPVTVELAAVSPALAEDYHYAAEHFDEFSQIPCYCGCETSLGHRNLAECYMTPTGAWDAHASGCAVCGLESASVRDGLGAGTPIGDVRAAIVATYGPPPGPFTEGAPS